ncbi:concanavalin A-like lectin/glucanase domain-containing protein [Chytridium lagenaria]|nr:concanavalin A-like lectin/glucanase domain-containing protein [Chytridium lagenaria]
MRNRFLLTSFMALKVAFVLGLFLLAIADVTHGLAAGGTGTSIKLRGRKWNYSPITNADYSNGDFIHIQGGCLDDAALLQPSANFSIEFWFRLDPEEMWNPVNVPHTFSMAQEYNFWVMYTIQISPGVYVWAGNWVSPCGWLATKSDTTSPFVNSGYIFLPTNTWIHFAVVNDNYGVTAYINGIAVASLFCPLPFDAAPVWTIGIRDWSTDVAKKNQLSPIFPMTGEIAEFRAWRRPISAAEVLNRMNRALLPSEIMDPSLTLYFDFNNITDGYILNDMSATKRLTGKMGGALGLEINIPKLVTSTAPVVNTSTSLVKVTMKESGDYSSRVPIPLFTVDARTASFDLLSSTSKVNYTITSLPDPSILTLSTSTTGETFNALSGTVPVALGSSFNLYVTHRANLSVTSWPAQTFSVTVALGGLIVNVPVIVTILKMQLLLSVIMGALLYPQTHLHQSLSDLSSSRNSPGEMERIMFRLL